MMCLGIPGEVLEIRDEQGLKVGKVQFGGITRDVCLACIPDIALGEFVLVHVGFAISKVDKQEAARAYATLQELGLLAELTSDAPQPEQPP
jgi:hydrogenase expression/formation protein HypC